MTGCFLLFSILFPMKLHIKMVCAMHHLQILPHMVLLYLKSHTQSHENLLRKMSCVITAKHSKKERFPILDKLLYFAVQPLVSELLLIKLSLVFCAMQAHLNQSHGAVLFNQYLMNKTTHSIASCSMPPITTIPLKYFHQYVFH